MGSSVSMLMKKYNCSEEDARFVVRHNEYQTNVRICELHLVNPDADDIIQVGSKKYYEPTTKDALVITANDVTKNLAAFEAMKERVLALEIEMAVLRKELRYFTDLRDAQIEFDLQKNKINK